MGTMHPPNNLAASPPIYFMEVKNSPHEPISFPQYPKIVNFAKSSPPISKNNQLLNHPPNAQHRFAPLSIKREFWLLFFKSYRPQNIVYSGAYTELSKVRYRYPSEMDTKPDLERSRSPFASLVAERTLILYCGQTGLRSGFGVSFL